MNRHQRNTLILAIIFGLAGAWVNENISEWFANFFVIPPMAYYLLNLKRAGEGLNLKNKKPPHE